MHDADVYALHNVYVYVPNDDCDCAYRDVRAYARVHARVSPLRSDYVGDPHDGHGDDATRARVCVDLLLCVCVGADARAAVRACGCALAYGRDRGCVCADGNAPSSRIRANRKRIIPKHRQANLQLMSLLRCLLGELLLLRPLLGGRKSYSCTKDQMWFDL